MNISASGEMGGSAGRMHRRELPPERNWQGLLRYSQTTRSDGRLDPLEPSGVGGAQCSSH